MTFVLAPTAATAGYRLESHDSVGSTNAMALERARDNDPGLLWIVSKSRKLEEDGAVAHGRPQRATLPQRSFSS